MPISPPLSLTGKRWVLPSAPESMEGNIVNFLSTQRGIDLQKSMIWNALCDPQTLGDMGKSVERIRFAINQKEGIGIIGDYDADGITGVAQLIRFFRRLGAEPHVILPHRQKHGYGVKKEFIDALCAKGVTLIITVDTGISAIEEIAYAKSKGIDVIVTDHHSVKAELPEALIVHPTAKGSHAYSPLSGSGVVFTLIRALEHDDWEGKEIDLALAAIGTVADVVPLLGENRTIVTLGLIAMNEGSSAPVFLLAQSVKKEGEKITSTTIGFRIAPRINATGRLADPHLSLQALLEGGGALDALQKLNDERREMTEKMLAEAEKMIDPTQPLLLLKSEDFHPGIIGLIAGKLTEKYGRPSLVGYLSEGKITCSLRSIPEFHIADILQKCSECLLTHGGHAAAGGCTLKVDCWNAFAEVMLTHARETLGDRALVPTIEIDLILEEVPSLDDVHKLCALEPFGEKNPEPRFLLKNQEISQKRCVGVEGDHLQCRVGNVKAIGFGLGSVFPSLPERADIVCRLGIDTWQGCEQVQLFIEDLAVVPVLSSEMHKLAP